MKKNYLKPINAVSEVGGKDMDINFGEAQRIAGEMIEKANTINAELNKITESVQNLANVWESSKSAEAQKVCAEFMETFAKFYRLVRVTPEKIEKVAQGLREAEQ